MAWTKYLRAACSFGDKGSFFVSAMIFEASVVCVTRG